MKTFIRFFACCLLPTACCFFSSCSNDTTQDDTTHSTTDNNKSSLPPAPKFNEDSAYAFVKAQVDFGPRVPGTTSHAKCAEYLVSKLKSFGWKTQIQNGNITTYDGKKFNLKNIIASYKPEITHRILLLSHWDSRPFADSATIDSDKPFDSADDGPSGVGVILEIARQLRIAQPNVGIDILFDDLEDYGKENDHNSWALGTQYWAKNPHTPAYKAQYGILLDMVGAKGATFPREGLSRESAPHIVKKIWNKASRLNYSNYFVFDDIHGITDDHAYIISEANIPCVDIVNWDFNTGNFAYYHHRHSDNMTIIDKNTLKAVGQTVLEVLWEEQKH
ncbi:MAG: M28 family peptidase [Bacteroidota bacterium]